MLERAFIVVLLIDAAIIVAVTFVVVLLRRWQRKVWLREQTTGRSVPIDRNAEEAE